MPLPTQVILYPQDVGNRRIWKGDPNGFVYGQRGWTCQDWTNGRLYVCEDEGVSSWGAVTVNSAQIPEGDTVGQILYWNGAGWAVESQFVDSLGAISIDIWNRNLTDEYSVLSVEWNYRTLRDGGNNTSLDWNSYLLLDVSGGNSVDWTSRYLLNSVNATIYDWQTNVIKDGGSPNYNSANFTARYLYNSLDNVVAHWSTGVHLRTAAGYEPKITQPTAGVTSAYIDALSSEQITLVSGTPFTISSSAGNNVLIVVQNASTVANAQINLVTLLNNMPSEGIIYIFSPVALTSLTLTITGYTPLVGAAIGSLAANGTHVLRKIGNKLYHVQ